MSYQLTSQSFFFRIVTYCNIYGRCHLYSVIVLVDWPKIELSPYLGKVMPGLIEMSVYGDPDTITNVLHRRKYT